MTTGRRHDEDPLAPLAPLTEPVRRRLYEFVVAEGVPVDRDRAADGVGVSRALAAFHLDRLAAAGLLDVQFRRRTGRRGPGAGRPAKYYARAAGPEVSVSLPPREYGLAAEILAAGVERRTDVMDSVLEAARERGAGIVDAAGAEGTPRARLLGLLAAHGYEPGEAPGGSVRLRNCPFHRLVDQHRQLTCSVNLSFLRGVAERLPGTGLIPEARPEDGFCCVAFTPEVDPIA